MRAKKLTIYVLFVLTSAAICPADTFKNKSTNEVFHGYATNKTQADKTLVYNSETEKFEAVRLYEYDITLDPLGRKDTVVIIPITQQEILLSQNITQFVAEAITDASNTGSKLVIIQIDSPGGKPQYMKTIADVISKSGNCPIVAYISGEKYGGAYSAASTIAFACSKIYINPKAVFGSDAPPYSIQSANYPQFGENVNPFRPPDISAYSTYAGLLAKNRPSVFAMAMLDTSIEVVEVIDTENKKWLINAANRKPNETVIRIWTAGSSSSELGRSSASSGYSSAPVLQSGWVVTAQEAVNTGLADKLAESISSIVNDFDAGNAKTIPNRAIASKAGQFNTSIKKATNVINTINYLEQVASSLQQQIDQIEQQTTTTPQTRQYSRGDPVNYRSSRTTYQDERLYNNTRNYDTQTTRRRDFGRAESEVITTVQPPASLPVIASELSATLTNLAAQYRSAAKLAKTWPDAFPAGTDWQTLQASLNSTIARQNDIQRKLSLLYTNQNQVQFQP